MKDLIEQVNGFMLASFALGMLLMFLLQLLLVELGTVMIPITIAIALAIFVIGMIIEYDNLRRLREEAYA